MAFDLFIKSSSFPGDTRDIQKEVAGGTDALSFNWGLGSPQDAVTGVSTGKYGGKLFSFNMRSGAASGPLGTFMAARTRAPLVQVLARRVGSTVIFMRLEFTDVGVEGLETSYAYGEGSARLETWSLSYRRVKMTYTPITATGTAGTPVVTEFGLQNF